MCPGLGSQEHQCTWCYTMKGFCVHVGLFLIPSPHWRPCVALFAWSTTKGVEIQGICTKMPLFWACPNCGSQIHVRKLACLCGHVFHRSKPLSTRNASRKGDVSAARALETEEQTAKRRKTNREHLEETRALETEEQTAKQKSNREREVRRDMYMHGQYC